MKLSIIIPTLNEEEYLPILLRQIKKQTFKDYEIIVADAGSKDKTVEIAKSFGCKIIKGGLPAKGRNEGAKIAKSNIFLFLDADNIFFPEDLLEKGLEEFERRNLVVAAFPIYVNGNFFDKICYFFYNLFVKITENFLPHASNIILIKKDVFEKVGGFDESIEIGEDHYLARQAKKYGKFGLLKAGPVITSARRLEVAGRFKIYSIYLFTGFYMLLFGALRKKIFNYHYNSIKNSKNKV